MKTRKKLYAASAAYILGFQPSFKLKGDPKRTSAYLSILEVSKKLYAALEEGQSIEKIDNLLQEKKQKSKHFTLITGLRWPF